MGQVLIRLIPSIRITCSSYQWFISWSIFIPYEYSKQNNKLLLVQETRLYSQNTYIYKDEDNIWTYWLYELLIEETSDIIVSRANLFSSRATLFALPILSKFHSILMTSFEYPLDSTESWWGWIDEPDQESTHAETILSFLLSLTWPCQQCSNQRK